MSISSKNKSISKGQIRKLIKDFCESTSLHGYSYLYNSNSKAMKLSWALVIFSFSGLGAIFLVNNTNAYMKAGLITTIESNNADLSVSMHIFLKKS